MSRNHRFAAVGAFLTIVGVYTCAHVWGESGRTPPHRPADQKAVPHQIAGDDDLANDLADTKFSTGELLTYHTQAGDLLFAMQVKPSLEAPPSRPTEIAILVDTSASQFGYPLNTAKRIASEMVAASGPDDRISIWTVNTPKFTRDLTRGFRTPQAGALDGALKALRDELPLGDTDLASAL